MNHPWLDNSVKRPWLAVFLVLLVTGIFSWGAKNLYFRGDFRIFFSNDNPQMQAFERMQAQFNKSDNMLVAVLPAEGDVFTPEVLTVVKKLTDAAWQTPYSLRVDSITNFQHTEAQEDDLLVEDLLLDTNDLNHEKINKIRSVVLNEPALVRRLIASDSTMAAVNITLQLPEKNQNKEVGDVYNHVLKITKQLEAEYPTVSFKMAGIIALTDAFTKEAQHDASRLVPLMFIAIILLLALLLRSALAALAVVIIIVLTISATLGLAGWSGIFLSTATVNVPTLVMTMAVADSVHLIASMQFLMRQGQPKPDAIRQAMTINAMPVFITSATTAIGFLTLNFSDVPILRDFGNMVAVGVMLAWLLTILLLPALLTLFSISKGFDSKQFSGFDVLANFVIRRSGFILIVTAILTIFGGYLMMQNRINDEAIKYFSLDTQYRQSMNVLEQHFGGISAIDFAIESGIESGVNDPEFISAIDTFGDYLQSLPEVKHVSRISDIYKRLNKSMHGDDPAFYRLPENQESAAQYLLMYEMSLPFGLDLSNQLDLDKSATKVGITMQNLGSKEMTAIENKTIAWFQQRYPQYPIEASSPALMFAHIGERNMASMMQSLPLAVVLISALLVLSLRSWKLGTLSLLPNIVPALLGFGVWQLLSGEINLGLSVVASMSLGIIVDDTVHFLAKYQHARRDGRDAEDAVRYAFHSVGWALVVTTVVLVIGFSVLLLSDFRLNSDMGLLTGIILLIALIVDFLFLPAVLLKLDRKAYAPAPAATHPNGV